MTTNNTTIFNEMTFYPAFTSDMLNAEKEVIIYSPFISKFRMNYLRKTIIKLRRKKIKFVIFTRSLDEHEEYVREEISSAIKSYEELGAQFIFLPGFIHEKIAVIDQKILWTGSMNILSQKSSREMMFRIDDESFAEQTISHLKLSEKLNNDFSFIKMPILLLESFIAVIKWSLSAIRQVMIVLLKGVLMIFNIIDVIL